jgi:hypothetical protein
LVARSSDASGNAGSVDEVADELYGLPADEFVATRNARAKAARDAGARDTASAITKFAKPNTAAWLANQLVRQHEDGIRSLVELGESMRVATASLDRDELRRLSTRQRQLVSDLVRQARDIATAGGLRLNDAAMRGLEDILHAALAEPDAADELSAGRLVGTLHSSGFPSGDMATWSPDASPGRSSTEASKATASRRSDAAGGLAADAKRDDGQRALAAAAAAAAAAESDRDAARVDLDRADRAVRDARAHADKVRHQLDEAVDELTAAEQARRSARTKADQADRAARLATRRLDAAGGRRRNSG